MSRPDAPVTATYAGGDRRRGTAMEKHLQTILAGIILALLAWFGWATTDLRDRMTKLEVKTDNVVSLTTQLNQTAAAEKKGEADRVEKDAEIRIKVQLLTDRVTRLEGEQRGRR